MNYINDWTNNINAGRLSRNKVKIAPRTKIKIKANIILTIYTEPIGLGSLLSPPGTFETWRKRKSTNKVLVNYS